MSVGVGGIPFWGGSAAEGDTYFDDDPWFLAYIGGIKVPGKSTISSGAVVRLDFDEKKAKGRHGATLTLLGVKAGPFDINVEIWTQEQHEKLLDLIDVIWAVPGKKTKLAALAVSVYHPALAYVKVYQATLIGVDPPKDGSFDGAKVIAFHFRWSIIANKNATVTVKPAPTVVQPLRATEIPKSATPPKPSSTRGDLGPKGPKTPPAGGSD
jgi:hypothetical protein